MSALRKDPLIGIERARELFTFQIIWIFALWNYLYSYIAGVILIKDILGAKIQMKHFLVFLKHCRPVKYWILED